MRKFCFLTVLCGLFSMPLFAQEYPSAEIYGGYQLVNNNDTSFHGFAAEVEKNVDQNFGLVGEFSFSKKSLESSIDSKQFYFAGGPQISYRQDKFRVFGHVMFGAVHQTVSMDLPVLGSVDASENDFMMIYGGGLDIALNENVSVRPAQLDIISVHHTGDWDGAFRYSAGIVFKLGSMGAD